MLCILFTDVDEDRGNGSDSIKFNSSDSESGMLVGHYHLNLQFTGPIYHHSSMDIHVPFYIIAGKLWLLSNSQLCICV